MKLTLVKEDLMHLHVMYPHGSHAFFFE